MAAGIISVDDTADQLLDDITNCLIVARAWLLQLPLTRYLDELKGEIGKFIIHCVQFLENSGSGGGGDIDQEVKDTEAVFLKVWWAELRQHVLRCLQLTDDDGDDGDGGADGDVRLEEGLEVGLEDSLDVPLAPGCHADGRPRKKIRLRRKTSC